MRCLSSAEIEDYILHLPMPAEQREAAARHIESCAHCGPLYEAELDEQARAAEALFADELPASFTADVMAKLDMGLPASVPDPIRPRKPLPRWRRAAAIASVLLVAGAFAAYSSPTLADLVRSLFSRDTVDYGMLKAQELGLVSNPNVTVKDKGFTIRINEAVADPARVVMALQLSGPDGKGLHDRLWLGEPNRIVVKDDQGREIGRLHDIGMTSAFYMLIGYFPEPTSADHITVEGTIRRLGNEMQQIPYVEGNWDFSFTVDLRQAKAQTKVIPLHGEYTAPDGITIRLKRLIRTVQGVRLELDTELSNKALARSPGELWKQQGLRFHFEDDAGEEIHSVNSRKSMHKDSLMSSTQTADARKGHMHMSYTFRYLPPGENYKLVLDGYYVTERSGAALDFNPAALREHPAMFRDSGDELRLTGFEIEANQDYPRIKDVEGVLRVQGEFVNEFHRDEWTVRDLQGNEYAIQMRGASSIGEKIVLENETAGKDYAFRIPGIRTIPDRLTLVRKVIDRTYSNVNWSAEIKEKE
ncbi:DUF4179 domain-containing protein [Paenibacillus allorhizosphaerae]|uniref:DUF4179 domain-containing protein n=1 Tax=Paenibacillus allorhizosphaerae TaxID=2849866 RepID=A0ABN7TNS9_9BACL|nr:DUF4179 domain-containing protein [Paenibacillus allorhizosphaerae]CAG7648994.1 hypothetical protein PAECIP111802_04372 [Paenibacillus allorhizosphaerae]